MAIQRRNDELEDLLLLPRNDGTYRFVAAIGSAAAPAFTFGSDLDTGLYRAGANQLGIATLGVRRGIWNATGALILNDAAASTFMTGPGVTINQGGGDDEIMAFQSTDVDHGGTNEADTNTWASIQKAQAISGGARFRGFKDADGVAGAAIVLDGLLSENADTTKDATAQGIIELAAFQISGVAKANLVANGNAVVMKAWRGGGADTLWILDEDGDVYIDGTQNIYDEFDDAVMAWDATRVLADRGGEILRYNKDALVRAGIMSPAGWISQRGTTKLLMGAVGQLWHHNQELEARIATLETA